MRREITPQAIIGAIIVSTLVSFSYPYIVLRIGLGPNVSLLSAFLGAVFLHLTARSTRGQNRWQNNIIQTAGTSAASTAFMCVIAAAFGYLAMNESVNVKVNIGRAEMFLWLACSGAIGVLFIALLRRFFLSDPRMRFPDGIAASKAIEVLDSGSKRAGGDLRALGLGTLVGAVVGLLREAAGLLQTAFLSRRFLVGAEWSALSFGTGLLLPLGIGTSMILGTAVVYLFGPIVVDNVGLQIVLSNVAPSYVEGCRALAALPSLTGEQWAFASAHCGMLGEYLRGQHFGIAMLWFMWPASALMITAALTAVLLRWRSIARMFADLARGRYGRSGQDLSPKYAIVGVAVFTVVLALVQHQNFGTSYVQTVAAVFATIPMMLVGVRVLGETNQGPVSLMANAVQGTFALVWPKHIAHNLIAAGMAGSANAQAEGTMQDFKTGRLLGSTPRLLTIVQLCAVPIGALAVTIMYPILIDRYGLGGGGLAAPTGLKIANVAILLSKGIQALPPGALTATVIAAVMGVVIALAQDVGKVRWLPNPAAFGFAMILPGFLNITIGIGSIAGWLWYRLSAPTHERYYQTVASGFIGGEALIAGLILPALFTMGVAG